MLYLSHKETVTKVLGPGRRYVLWTQGCKKNCRGCIFPAGRNLNSGGEWISIEKLFAEIKISAEKNSLTGITISGGEPFLQPAALARLVYFVRKETLLDVMIFSGYRLEELQRRNDKATNFLLENVDLLIDGEYIENLNTNTIYRGSENQRVHFLSKKYLPFKKKIEQTKNRSIEFVSKEDGELFMIGVPPKDFEKKFLENIFGEV